MTRTCLWGIYHKLSFCFSYKWKKKRNQVYNNSQYGINLNTTLSVHGGKKPTCFVSFKMYLKSREKKEISCPLVHPPNGHSRQFWIRSEKGAKSLLGVTGAQVLSPSFAVFTGALSGSLIRSVATGFQLAFQYRTQTSQVVAYSLCQNTALVLSF